MAVYKQALTDELTKILTPNVSTDLLHDIKRNAELNTGRTLYPLSELTVLVSQQIWPNLPFGFTKQFERINLCL